MSKKAEVPQELLDQIIDCYVNQQLSLEKTIIKLKLPFGRNPLKRILTENGIHIRTYKEAANIGVRQPIPQDMQKIIVDLYQKGFSIERIQKELTVFFSSDKIKKTLQENNIQLRTLEEAKKVQIDFEERKYPVDDDYLLESHNGAWLLGFIASDGYLPITKGAKNRIVISLARKDEDVLKLIAKELKYEGPIYQYTASDGESLISTLAFSSKKIRRQLEEKYGIVNNKTFKIHELPSNLPNEYMLDYIRGYFDGDGSVFKLRDKRINMSITSANKDFLESVQQYLQRYDLSSRIVPDHNTFDLKFGVKDSLKFGQLLYDNNYLALPRKKEKFYELSNLPRA